jgi:hypothetical protein
VEGLLEPLRAAETAEPLVGGGILYPDVLRDSCGQVIVFGGGSISVQNGGDLYGGPAFTQVGEVRRIVCSCGAHLRVEAIPRNGTPI